MTLADGRRASLAEQPLPDGSWVATHDDVTEQYRPSSSAPPAVAGSAARIRRGGDRLVPRARRECSARVGDNAAAIKMTAGTLLASSEQTSRQAEGAVQATDRASHNTVTAAAAADELATSIADMSKQLGQTTGVAQAGGERGAGDQRADFGACRVLAEDRRRGAIDPQHRRPDQLAGAQRDDRSRARRRSGQGLRRGRVRGEVARRPDGEGDGGNIGPDRLGSGIDQDRRRRDPPHQQPHAGYRPSRLRRCRLGGAAEFGNVGDIAQRLQCRAGYRRCRERAQSALECRRRDAQIRRERAQSLGIGRQCGFQPPLRGRRLSQKVAV
jgi:hypothetical protein